jgi:crotonobetainyl-CoA:carnitine CoA-transferase CaiB-like acyl-CoA transferase
VPVPILNRITVIECATFVTGPYATALLADLGARVIKIESVPQGDPYRYFAPDPFFSFNFAHLNRNNESLILDLKAPKAKRSASIWRQRPMCSWKIFDPAPPPLVGEHSRKILQELGYDGDAVSDLQSRGVTKAL